MRLRIFCHHIALEAAVGPARVDIGGGERCRLHQVPQGRKEEGDSVYDGSSGEAPGNGPPGRRRGNLEKKSQQLVVRDFVVVAALVLCVV